MVWTQQEKCKGISGPIGGFMIQKHSRRRTTCVLLTTLWYSRGLVIYGFSFLKVNNQELRVYWCDMFFNENDDRLLLFQSEQINNDDLIDEVDQLTDYIDYVSMQKSESEDEVGLSYFL